MKPETERRVLPDPPRNILFTIEYDGAGYVGWELQANGPSIQGELEKAIHQITGESPTLNGSGRTDAGVHAVAQNASFTLVNPILIEDLRRGVTAMLPRDIAVTRAEERSLAFHARFSAVSKTYRYQVWNAPVRSPLHSRQSHHIRRRLDLDAMTLAAQHLLGRHDFSAFAREPESRDTCVRTILELKISSEDDMVIFSITGDGFLYNMVRIIVGTLLQVGCCEMEPSEVARIRDSKDRILAGPTVPSCGLSLLRVSYR